MLYEGLTFIASSLFVGVAFPLMLAVPAKSAHQDR